MDKNEVYEFLTKNGYHFEIANHKAVFTMDEATKVDIPHSDAEAKNLFIRDNKKENFYLISMKGDKRADLKEFRKKVNSKPLTFASADELKAYLDLTPGSVTPLGILSDKNCVVKVFIDSDFRDGLIGIHPNDNTATVFLQTSDLFSLVSAHGNEINFIEI